MSGIGSAISKALFGKKKQSTGNSTPDITYNPTNKNIPYSAKTPADAKLGNEYAKDPTNPKFLGVDPARFGYPADNTAKSGIAVGNPNKINLKNSKSKINLK